MKYPESFYQSLETETNAIVDYWKNNSVDDEKGGFLGKRDYFNTIEHNANKGIILNTRLLWSFSTLQSHNTDYQLRDLAKRSFNYLENYFQDKENDGLFWELTADGEPLQTKKQIYAQAFGIYSLVEYYKISQDENAKNWAISLFNLIEKHALDTKNEGYIEAFQEDWSPLTDVRLSEKDMNAEKTMNTHLHILEAYTALLQIHQDEKVTNALKNLIRLFFDKFLNKDFNFELFFDKKWNLISDEISFGHDIEAAWLLIDAAREIQDKELIELTENAAIKIADRFLKLGYQKGEGVYNELNRSTQKIDTDKHWWPQVEAMVGLHYAYQLTNEDNYKNAIVDIWEFTQNNLIDRENGEWHFRVNQYNVPYENEDKLSMWKAPYHNSRALINLLKDKP
ncbi:AGE family epimerase/isomerase [Mesonia aestuariivivens]|uniref:Cellobiose 2-epimerase n=1 Tax=Mesonia aestuariivivens TaxID=2796128 RepID=A0ABS6W4D3_9FLAO|nr:AGE family epimerase/isomerase [Mesonia aestuariivivens]MBW2962736.1 AGE family epimerase/isomerase [Mesonia aestuariivivens]